MVPEDVSASKEVVEVGVPCDECGGSRAECLRCFGEGYVYEFYSLEGFRSIVSASASVNGSSPRLTRSEPVSG